LIPGSFTATFVMPGYIEQTVNGTSASGQTHTLDIQLTPVPPLTLAITSPLNGAVFSSSPITVTGNVSNNANVTVNGVQVSVSNNIFSASIPLSEGPNSIFVAATDQYGQTASQFIYVTLDTGGTGGIITGTVTDSTTGLPLPSATVSVTDSLIGPQGEGRLALFIIIGKTALTDSNGRYTIYNISPGAFSGSITKEGYATYNFSGTMASGQTVTINAALNPILPVISNIVVSGITKNSATITWTTDQLADSLVEYGTTTSYGSSLKDSILTTSHTILLSNLIPATTYHFKVTSTNSYGFSSSSGDLTFVTSSPPTISAIVVGSITPNSSTITWTTDQLTDSSVDYGTTTAYGSTARDSTLTTSHTILLTNLIPATTYHFKVTSTNGYGLSASSGDLTFKTSSPLISLAITFPSDGSTMSVRDIIVKGTVIHSRGSETGVVVNGILANIYGTEFVVNHVPLVDGPNTITATATDIDGNTETASVTVNGVPATNYIRITASTESGISPLEATLTIESSLDLTSASLTYAGPGQVEFLSTSTSEYRVRMVTEGIYYFTAKVTDSSGNLYTDTIAITVLPEAYLDGLLRGKWEVMKRALSNKDISKGLDFFLDSSREVYEQAFSVILDELPQIVSDMQDIELIFLSDNVAKYRINRVHDIDGTPQTITYYIYFVKDLNGLWKIDRF